MQQGGSGTTGREENPCLLLVPAVVLGWWVWPAWGGQVETTTGVQRSKEGQTYSCHDFCSIKVISIPGYGLWTSVLHHRHSCAWIRSWKKWPWSRGWCSCSSHRSLGQGCRGLAAGTGPCLFALGPVTSGATAAKDYADQHQFLSSIRIRAHG